MKKQLLIISVPSLSILTLPFILSLFNLFKFEIYPLIYLLSMIIITFISGFLLGKTTNKKAYLKGIILGCIISLVMFILSLILRSEYNIFTLVYYAILITSSTLGSMVGISKKG